MILGIDHLALSVTDTDAAKIRLEKQGFSCAFSEKNIENNPAKKTLLRHYQPLHDLAIFRSPGTGVSIETTNHGSDRVQKTAPYRYQREYIELETTNIEQEMNFWQNALFFKPIDKYLLEFSSLVPDWSCRLKLKQVSGLKPCTLDAQGYPCLALLSNNLLHDMDVIIQAGAYDVLASFTAYVNHKPLDIAMFRTPSGAICELIQIGK